MRRRGLLMGALNASLLSACSRERFFNIGWDEEVQLHDGRVIVVKVKYTYERLGSRMTLDRYEPSILRATEFNFDAGLPIGRFSQIFQKHRVNTVEQLDGKWYLVLETRGDELYTQTATGWQAEWGLAEDGSGHKCLRLDSARLVRISIDDLPEEVLQPNILFDTARATELASFNGTTLTLSQKAIYLAQYPLHPDETQIKRRHASAKGR